jgi:Tol biopolymer transport system component
LGNPNRPAIWSPDGHWLLYQHGTQVYSVDMSSAAPGLPVLLTSEGPGTSITLPGLSWSADSKSVAMTKASSSTLLSPQVQVFDPTQPAPLMRPLSTAATALLWAPVGDRVLYSDSSGTHVRRVQAGVPGPEQLLEGDSFSWSPDGNAVLSVYRGKLMLNDVTQTPPIQVTLANPDTLWATVDQLAFSPDGSRLLFAGQQIQNFQKDLFVVNLKPTVENPVRISQALMANETLTDDFLLSPDGKWVIYSMFDAEHETTAWAVDLSGAKPGSPFKTVATPIDESSWVPNAPEKFIGYFGGGFGMFDIANPGLAAISVVNSGGGFSLSSLGAIAYSSLTGVFARDLFHPELPTAQLSQNGGPTMWRWSPDGNFIAVATSTQSRLYRWQNSTASNPVALGSIRGIDWLKWQPLPH